MLMLLIMFLVIMLIGIGLFLVSFLFSEKSEKDREKNSPFECGFDPFSSSRLPFSLRFFLIAIIFLIFDIEIVLILPYPISMSLIEIKSLFLIGQIFLFILLVGLIHEWMQGALDWAI
uniref:NADH-ubiquinone oxidoreductase chain 3 n=1 Tax=Epiperipatus biolleyi TaxID=172520 RepID=A3QU27_EPIBI|nr:NADH dehydrogenase subunit 3 [Epiperipatus biolleyi]ABF93289.1 NADH dehydrogenase subunit 3 [Epiperipatus biolleyi]ADK97560.1 NADH dehydrogenase subunit 3 [Epiperipatus biolleyi]